MSTQWLIAKYTSDLRRRETRNVGVITMRDGVVACRFVGEGTTASGAIDGRSVRHWANSLPNYKAWVDYWRKVASSEPAESRLEKLLKKRSDANYYLEAGGSLLFGEDEGPEALSERLFSQLVDRPVQASSDSLRPDRRDVETMSTEIFMALNVWDHVEKDTSLVLAGHRAHFDYRYDNSVPNLMNRVELGRRRKDWKLVEGAAWAFEKARAGLATANCIALTACRDDDDEAKSQRKLLADFAEVVDVSDEAAASNQLKALFHL